MIDATKDRKQRSHNVIKQLACLVVAHIRMHASTAQDTFLVQMGEASGGIAYILQMAEQEKGPRPHSKSGPTPICVEPTRIWSNTHFRLSPTIGIDFARLFSGPTGFNTA